MAVQKNRKTRSKRGMRRGHDGIKMPKLNADQMTGEVHLRHHVAPDGFYKGEEIVAKADDAADEQA